MGRPGSLARPLPQTLTVYLLPGSAPLVYVPYLTGADPGSPILQADRQPHRIRAGYLMTPFSVLYMWMSRLPGRPRI